LTWTASCTAATADEPPEGNSGLAANDHTDVARIPTVNNPINQTLLIDTSRKDLG
jgi:hypothetical protein